MFSNSYSAAANQHGSAPSIISSDVVVTGILHENLEVEFGAFVEGMFRHSPDPLAPAL